MSTDINIKKKLAILNEGAISTNDATSINFVGSGVYTAATNGNTTVTIPGGSGTTTYYLNQSVPQSPYNEFSSIATSAVEQIVPLTVLAGATSIIAQFQTPVGVPNTTQIPGGLWQFFLHFNAGSTGQNWIIRPTVYKRDLGGIETLLFTSDPEIVTNMSTTTTMYLSDGVFPTSTVLTTDRLVVRISVENTSGVSQTVNFRTEGSQHYSVGITTLNQTVSAGSVTSVTGSSPIVSSGGTTPSISINQATTSTNGYLNSTDWNTFNGKLSGTGTINYLSKWSSSTGLTNSLLQDNGTSMSVNTAPNSTYGFYYNYASGQASIFGQNTFTGAGDSAGVVGSGGGTVTGTNLGGSFLAFNNTTLNIGVKGSANSPTAGTNIGGYFLVANGTNNYSIQLQDGTNAVGKFLKSVTSDGKANWASITTSDISGYVAPTVSGSGTLNYLTKWSPSGTVLGNSLIQDDGTSLGLGTNPNASIKLDVYSTLVQSIRGVNGSTSVGNKTAIEGTANGANGTNIGGYFYAQNGTNNYSLWLSDGTAGIGKVLTSMTADGKAQWVTPTTTNIYNTNGTLTSNRLVTLGTNDITFNGFGASGTTQFTRNDGSQSAQIVLQNTTINQIVNNSTDARQTARNQTVDYHQQSVQSTSLLYSVQYQDATNWYTQIFNASSVSLFKINVSSSGLNINNAYTFPKVDGTANQVLKTNGTGTVTWNTLSVADTGLTLTTTGTSGAATLIGNTLNIPEYAGGSGTVPQSIINSSLIFYSNNC